MKKRLFMILIVFMLSIFLASAQECIDDDFDDYGLFGDAACTLEGVDCDDSDEDVHPNAIEKCDGLDNDCDGYVDELAECPSICGDGACDEGEDFADCPIDCTEEGGSTLEDVCPDDECTGEETADTCSQDCKGSCGDGICNNEYYVVEERETTDNCPSDCGSGLAVDDCGDGICQSLETYDSCPDDCAEGCGDSVCSETESNADCPHDCLASCGDDNCDPAEDENTCPKDCALIDFGTCNISVVDFYESDGTTPLGETVEEGTSIKLVAEVTNPGDISDCNDLPMIFLIYDFNLSDSLTSTELHYSEVDVQNGKAELAWEVVYYEDSVEDREAGETNPEYYAAAVFYDGQDVISYNETPRFVVGYQQGQTPPADIGETDVDDGVGEPSGDDLEDEEAVQCSDTEDNDNDGLVDLDDPGCLDADDDNETDDSATGIGATVDFSGCLINSLAIVDVTGNPIEHSMEGDVVTLTADVGGCDGNPLTFVIIEFDDVDPDTGDIIGDEAGNFEVTIENGLASYDWTSAYMEDEPDPETADTLPDYVVFAALVSEDEVFAASDPSWFTVVPAGQEPPEDVGAATEDAQLPGTDETTAQEGTQVQVGAAQTGTDYQQRGAGRGAAAEGFGEEADTCGDAVCGETEDEQSCPEDCLEVGGGFALTLFIILLLLFIGGGVGFFFYRRWQKKKKFVEEMKKEVAEPKPVEPQPAQPKPILPVQPAQPQQPMQPKPQQPSQPQQPVQPQQVQPMPFADNNQLQATINFINSAKAQGLSDDKIKEMLKSSNYTQQQIDYAFANLPK